MNIKEFKWHKSSENCLPEIDVPVVIGMFNNDGSEYYIDGCLAEYSSEMSRSRYDRETKYMYYWDLSPHDWCSERIENTYWSYIPKIKE